MSTRRWFSVSLLLLVAAIFMAAALTPAVRLGLQNWIDGGKREILATVEGDLLGDRSTVKVVKFKEHGTITLEIFAPPDKGPVGGSPKLIDRMNLPDRRDGLFNFRGQVTRLAIADVDGDGRPELMAPTFDDQLVPHLNVYRFDRAGKRFEAVQPGPEP